MAIRKIVCFKKTYAQLDARRFVYDTLLIRHLIANNSVLTANNAVTELIIENLNFSDQEEEKSTCFIGIFTSKLKAIFCACDKDQPTFERFLFKMIIFGVFMFYFWMCDGLHIWYEIIFLLTPKDIVNKHWSENGHQFLA